MDTTVISRAPYRLLAAGCGDIVSNSTAVKDWTLARNLRGEEYSNYAASFRRHWSPAAWP
jgi:glycerol-1-phosphate dehydrogenase [NAD(P)+]